MILPKRFKAIFKIPVQKDEFNRNIVSIAKAEYVVSPPRKPVIINNLSHSDGVKWKNIAVRRPIVKLPTTLTLSVARGISYGKLLVIITFT